MGERGLKPTFAIDVDNTLIHDVDGAVRVNEDVRALAVSLHNLGVVNLVLWSGGGADYARHVAYKFGISHLFDAFLPKNVRVQIALDDQDMTLGDVNLKLPGDNDATPWMGI